MRIFNAKVKFPSRHEKPVFQFFDKYIKTIKKPRFQYFIQLPKLVLIKNTTMLVHLFYGYLNKMVTFYDGTEKLWYFFHYHIED